MTLNFQSSCPHLPGDGFSLVRGGGGGGLRLGDLGELDKNSPR